MPPQRAFRHIRVIEIVRRVTGHAEPLHDATGTLICGHGDRDDLFKTKFAESRN